MKNRDNHEPGGLNGEVRTRGLCVPSAELCLLSYIQKWLRMAGSNCRIWESKSHALPLGESSVLRRKTAAFFCYLTTGVGFGFGLIGAGVGTVGVGTLGMSGMSDCVILIIVLPPFKIYYFGAASAIRTLGTESVQRFSRPSH